MPDKSTPNPSDKDPDQIPKEQARPRLKLKRLVVKDLEIHPHVDPDSEPVPKAEPFVEPEPPPVAPPVPKDPDPVQDEPEKQEEEPEPLGEIQETPVEEPQKAKLVLDKPQADHAGKLEDESPPPEVKKSPPAPKGKKKAESKTRKRRTSTVVFPLVLIIGSLLYGVHVIFDPFGLKPEPIVPRDVPIQAVQPESPDPETQAMVSSLDNVPAPEAGSLNGIQAYVEKLAKLPIEISTNPDGVFIGSVYYSEGMSLNPSLGLVVDSISSEPGNQLLLLRDAKGLTYAIPVD